jgi:hypothetical protein
MGDLTEVIAAVLQRGATSASNHSACLKELIELLDDPSQVFPTVFHDTLLVFLFSKQLKAEAAVRLRDLFAKFLGAPDRDSLSSESRHTLSRTISKCMSTLKKACQVQDNDIRACSTAILAIICKLGAKWWPDQVMYELSDTFMKRLEDKIVAVRMAASDCLMFLTPHLPAERALKLERRLRFLASEDSRSEVRSVALRTLSSASESVNVIIERTGDYDGSVRTAALQRAAELPLESFSVDSVHTVVNNAYTAAVTYEASMTSSVEKEEEPMPLEKAAGREVAFSAESRRRREEQALMHVLDMLLTAVENNLWAFLNWLPLDANPQACLYVLHALFARGLEFPEDFSTREMQEPLDTHKNVAVAVVFCERLSRQPNGHQSIDDLVPEPLDVAGEFDVTDDVASSKIFLLLKLCKFLDYSDESGRSGMERTLLDLLKKKPPTHILKLVLSNLRLVQNVVQIYTENIVTVILSDYLDYTDDSSWDGVLSVTSELLASLPLHSTEFAALARIEEDILTPAKKPVLASQDQALFAKYTECIGALGKFVARTRDEHFDDLCFWVTNQKKAPLLRATAITAIVTWFLLPNVVLTGAMDIENFASALLKIINDTPLHAPLTFAALAGLLRLLFSNRVKTDSIISQFLQLAFLKLPNDPRLKTPISSFLPTWASYPESRPIICDGFLHSIRHFPDDVPPPHRKLIWRYLLRLVFEHSSLQNEVGQYNFSIAKKCLKTVYASERADPMEILKELDFVGLTEIERQQLDRMLGKVVSKFPVHENATKRILGTLMNPAEMKNRASAKFPEPPQKKEKATSSTGRASLDSEAHKKLAAKSVLHQSAERRQKKRAHEEIDQADANDLSSSPSATQVARTEALSRLKGQYEELDDYELATAAEEPKTPAKASRTSRGAVASRSNAKEVPSSLSKKTSVAETPMRAKKAEKVVPFTEPKPKRSKMSPNPGEEDDLTDTNALLAQLESRLGGDATARAKIKELSNLVADATIRESKPDSGPSRRLVSKSKIGGRLNDDDEEDDFLHEKPLVHPQKPSNKMEIEEEEADFLEPAASRPKRARAPSAVKEEVTSSQRRSTHLSTPKAAIELSSGEDELLMPAMKKPPRRAEASASPSQIPPTPTPAEPRTKASKIGRIQTLEVNRSINSDDSSQNTQSKRSPSKPQAATASQSSLDASVSTSKIRRGPPSAEEAQKVDWKKQHFPALSAPHGPIHIGLLGYASHTEESQAYIEALARIKIKAEEIKRFDSTSQVTHLVIRKGESPSSTSSSFAVKGIWIMSSRWIDAMLEEGKKVPETEFGARITKSLFQGQNVFFSPQLSSNGPIKRLAQAMVKEGGGSVTINSNKAHYILATNEDDISFLIDQFDGMPILSISTLLDDCHKFVP